MCVCVYCMCLSYRYICAAGAPRTGPWGGFTSWIRPVTRGDASTLENHHEKCVNQLFLWPCSIAFWCFLYVYQRVVVSWNKAIDSNQDLDRGRQIFRLQNAMWMVHLSRRRPFACWFPSLRSALAEREFFLYALLFHAQIWESETEHLWSVPFGVKQSLFYTVLYTSNFCIMGACIAMPSWLYSGISQFHTFKACPKIKDLWDDSHFSGFLIRMEDSQNGDARTHFEGDCKKSINSMQMRLQEEEFNHTPRSCFLFRQPWTWFHHGEPKHLPRWWVCCHCFTENPVIARIPFFKGNTFTTNLYKDVRGPSWDILEFSKKRIRHSSLS